MLKLKHEIIDQAISKYYIPNCFPMSWQRVSFISGCLGTGACLAFVVDNPGSSLSAI